MKIPAIFADIHKLMSSIMTEYYQALHGQKILAFYLHEIWGW